MIFFINLRVFLSHINISGMIKNLHNGSFRRMLMTILLSTALLSALAQVKLNNATSEFNLEENSFSGITVSNSFTTFNTLSVNTEKGVFTEIVAERYTPAQETGMPKLPVMRRLIEIPVGATPEVTIISADVKEFSLANLGITTPILPFQPPVAKSQAPGKFVMNTAAYNENRFIGNEPATVEIIGTMRDTRMARLELSPMSYNPVTGTIRVYLNMVVRVEFKGGDFSATELLKNKLASPYFNKLGKMLANELPLNDSREYIVQYPVNMVIVSDPMFQTALQPYVQWKTRKGFHITEAYTNNPAVGTTTSSIKAYLQNLYDVGTPENPAPSFVLFVGDVAQIPAFSQGGHVTDLYYCEYTNDDVPEVYYGRFSATSLSELQPQIDKTLMYEQYAFPDPAFLGECVMVSGVDGNFAPVHGNGQINYGTTYYFNEAHGLLSHTYLYPASGSASAQIIQHVSDGVGYANYTAHGSSSGWADPSFSISDIPGLQNDGEYPLMVGNCCQTSMYNLNCFGEALLRAENKGAIGYIGGSNNTYWDEDFYFGVGVGAITANPTYQNTTLGNYDRLFHDNGEAHDEWYTTMAQMIFAGNLAVTEGSPDMMEYYWQIYCLMGDPSLMAYMGVPSAMQVTYDPLMPLSSTEFTVNAAPYAYVAISKDGVLYGSALADPNGVAVVTLQPITIPGTADIVITAQNKQPFIGTVLVASPEGPYIIMDGQSVNDEAGNNNLQIDFNETFGFNLTLKNVGNSASSNLITTISSECPYITCKVSSENWNSIAPGETANMPLAFEISSAMWLPDQFTSVFTLTITDGSEVWTYNFNVKLNAPKLAAQAIIVDDSQNADPNGRIDAGETVIIRVPVINAGHCDAPAALSYLFTDSDVASISESLTVLGAMPVNQAMYAEYQVVIDAGVEAGTMINFFSSSNADPYMVTRVYQLPVGLLIEDFETGDFTAYAWQNGTSTPWIISNNTVYGGSFSATSFDIPDYQSSTLSIQMMVGSDSEISFARKVSSEAGYDFLKFSIDGTEKASYSGEENWSVVNFPVTAGNHTFTWTYSKDQSVSEGSDAGYIDDIIFPGGTAGGGGNAFAVFPFSYPETACAQNELQLFAFSLNETGDVSYEWTPAEYLNNDSIYNPLAIISEPVTFHVTATCAFLNAEAGLEMQVNAVPDAPAITQQNKTLVSSVAEGNQWYTRNGAIEGATGQTFEPAVTDYYHCRVISANGCISEASNEIYMLVVSVPVYDKAKDLSVYPNPIKNTLFVDFNLPNVAHVKISLLNLLGQEEQVFYNDNALPAGNHQFKFDARSTRPGVYFLKYEANDRTIIRKVVLIK